MAPPMSVPSHGRAVHHFARDTGLAPKLEILLDEAGQGAVWRTTGRCRRGPVVIARMGFGAVLNAVVDLLNYLLVVVIKP
eukprot:1190070-Prorocentrum_minimum.AAC.2